MDSTPISRRVSWACLETVEVAPDWPVGIPPLIQFYFIHPHHIRLYYRSLREDRHETSCPMYTYYGLSILNRSHQGKVKHVDYFDIFNRDQFIWNNFECYGCVSTDPKYGANMNDYISYYEPIYKKFIETILD